MAEENACGGVHCIYCKQHIDIDSISYCYITAPNSAKMANTMHGVEAFDKITKQDYCSGRCLMLAFLKSLVQGGEEGIFDPSISFHAAAIALMLMTESPEQLKQRKATLDKILKEKGL